MDITFTIPTEKSQRMVDATKFFNPIPQINTGTEEEPVMENEFTDNQWAKEAWRRKMIEQTRRYETFIAKKAVNIPLDDDMIS